VSKVTAAVRVLEWRAKSPPAAGKTGATETPNSDREVVPVFLQRADRDASLRADCCRCGHKVPAPLLWTVEPSPEGAKWCSACLVIDALQAIAAGVFAAATADQPGVRCDRCMRRSRPTALHFGFNLCKECREGHP